MCMWAGRRGQGSVSQTNSLLSEETEGAGFNTRLYPTALRLGPEPSTKIKSRRLTNWATEASLYYYTEFRLNLQLLSNKLFGMLIGTMRKLYINLERSDILKVLSILIMKTVCFSINIFIFLQESFIVFSVQILHIFYTIFDAT